MSVNVAVMGSTGSIGTSAIDVIENLEGFNIFALSANTNTEKLKNQIKKHRPAYAAMASENAFDTLAKEPEGPGSTKLLKGMEGICELCSMEEVDIIVNGLAGIAGLSPAVAGLKAGKRMAIANKESIVMGWHLIREALASGGQLIPVDSEHSALFQLIKDEDKENIRRLIITASGGAVYHKSLKELEKTGIKECLNHPTWDMGLKITVDSATLMNKGLEIIEAHYLFDMPLEKIDFLIHSRSIVHGLAEFKDGSITAHMGPPDMKIPIQYAITYPQRKETPAGPLDFKDMFNIKFSRPDEKKFPCPAIARRAASQGGMKNILLCAADEIAVEAFSRGELKFTLIGKFIEEVINEDISCCLDSVEDVQNSYREALEIAQSRLRKKGVWK
ncbi:MAG: 1-deoxy-D-xylulose-5-phosphate reductoisomerase [Elusimicrobiota bacterium]